MILIGQYDSPFVRRVGVAMKRYEIPFEHRPWSVWGNAEDLAQYNPLRRVPTLVLEDGECLVESSAILDALDEMVSVDRAMLPRSGAARRDGLRICALATGMADKAVSLFYEPLLRTHPSAKWVERCRSQMMDTLLVLEKDRALRMSEWWLGDSLTHADVAVACALGFVHAAHPGAFDASLYPTLSRDAERCEMLPEFREIFQPFIVTVGK